MTMTIRGDMLDMLSREASELDDETLAKAAAEILERPSDFYRRDERVYETHGPIHWWAPDSDDVIGESNHYALMEALAPFVGDEDDPDVYEATVGHWTYSYFWQVLVRVYDETGNYTPAFREAVALGLALRDYPILDESDYAEREWGYFEKYLRESMDYAVSSLEIEHDAEFPTDEVEEARERVYQRIGDEGQWCRSEDVDDDEVREMMREALAHLIPADS